MQERYWFSDQIKLSYQTPLWAGHNHATYTPLAPYSEDSHPGYGISLHASLCWGCCAFSLICCHKDLELPFVAELSVTEFPWETGLEVFCPESTKLEMKAPHFHQKNCTKQLKISFENSRQYEYFLAGIFYRNRLPNALLLFFGSEQVMIWAITHQTHVIDAEPCTCDDITIFCAQPETTRLIYEVKCGECDETNNLLTIWTSTTWSVL
jgi:hypothetical protein